MGNTPNIDRIAREGMLFTDHYGQPSCTAGRAAFITGQLPIRTGMTTVGVPGSKLGIQKEDPTAGRRGWTVVDMKRDWKTIYPPTRE
jgi:arylsulfatase A-like enzyme